MLERRHRSSADGDLIKDFPVRHTRHPASVGEVSGRRRVHPGFRSITFAVLPMALGALVPVKVTRRSQISVRGLQGIAEFLELFGNNPRLALFVSRIASYDANQQEQQSENDLLRFATARDIGRHGGHKKSSHNWPEDESGAGKRICDGISAVKNRGARDQAARKTSQTSSPLKKRMAEATIQATI